MSECRMVDFTQVPDLVSQVTRLSADAFAEYEGAPVVGDDFTRWYLRRPGCSPQLCVGALAGQQLVSMVLVAIQPVQLGGRLLRCGIIDSVATDPGHRKRGLARKLMDMAHARMRVAGADAGLLYTNPAGHPYHFYGRLGYQTRARCAMLEGNRPAAQGDLSVRPATDREHHALADMLDTFYAAHEGYAPLDARLWDWHKVTRPAEIPLQLLVAEARGRLVATCSLASVQLLLGADTVPVTAVADFAWAGEAFAPQEVLSCLLAAAAQDKLVYLLDESDPLVDLCQAVGLQKAVGEVSMVLPFTDQARQALNGKSGPWYVMAESVIGV